MIDAAIEANDLSKTFPGGVVAVNGLDLRVEKGSVYGLIGRNGAGKTTLIRMLVGVLRPDGGVARVLGADMLRSDRRTRQRFAYVSQTQQLHAWMTVEELCHYLSHFYEKWDAAYARDLAGRFGLAWDRQVGLMSGGEQRKVSVLLAFAARPEVLLLDEPAAGLDPIARRELIDEIIDVIGRAEGCTVLFSTHIISDLERVADTVGIMDRGRIITSQNLDDLKSRTKRVQVVFDGEGPPRDFVIPGTVRSKTEGPVVTAVVRIDDESQLDAVRAIPGVRVNVFALGLEETFIELFGPASRGEFANGGTS